LCLGFADASVRERDQRTGFVDLGAFRHGVEGDQRLAGLHRLPLAHEDSIHAATRTLGAMTMRGAATRASSVDTNGRK